MNLVILFKEDFVSESKVILTDRRLKHVLSIHKANEGDTLKVGLLNGKIGTGLITHINKSEMEMEVKLFNDSPKPLDLKLVLAMPRPKFLKRVIQDVTSMGIKEIYIIKTWRVDKSYWNSSVLEEENLLQYMILGLEQAKDTVLPKIHIEKFFKPFVEDKLPNIIKDTEAIVAHPKSKDKCTYNLSKPVTLAIGPEGGFIDYEIEMLEKQGFKVMTLGDRILRVETAIPYIIGKLK